ncbi:iron-containing alcohol dehydrogenase [Pseudomonas sp. Q2-TVG4-2]|uniref:iron-containing alcohol dehydrogenase n=1 Tax=Pseudomonas sp. Q2-TVG4-2 TaxID=1685699 RepID=UPI0015E67B34|nr:iron-containing alcohol dehydrogenase [Pseudomonas sp. Q2-TVG4-2]
MRTEDLIHFCAPARLIIGNGARHQLPQLLARLGYRSGVLVTDAFFAEKTPWVNEYTQAAERLGISTIVYAGGLPDPTTDLCDEATTVLRKQLGGKQLDHVIALGGGSNIDLAKALSLTLPQGQPITAFTGDIGGCKPLPMIALPTTSGTGSEATPGAILLDPANATKIAVMDNALRPHIALIDPEFTYTCPPRVTADAGIDAFTHAIESFLTLDSALFDRAGNPDPGYSGRSPLTMLFAKESLRLCFDWMERAYQHGEDTEARVGMAYASIYAALSYGTAGLNAGHGIAYAVAGQTHKSHGSTNAVMLPYVLDALCHTRQSELAEIAGLMGLATSCPEESARKVPVEVRAMIGRLDIPTDLRAFGIQEQMLEALVTDALAVTRLVKAFPVADAALAYRQIVQSAWEGRLSGQP